MSENTRAVKSALDTLKKHGIVDRYDAEPEKDGRKIIDVRYRVYATQEFVSQTISHNRHRNELSAHQFQVMKRDCREARADLAARRRVKKASI